MMMRMITMVTKTTTMMMRIIMAVTMTKTMLKTKQIDTWSATEGGL